MKKWLARLWTRRCHPADEGFQDLGTPADRAKKLRRLHAGSPREESYEVKVPRKFLRFFTAHNKVYLSVFKGNKGKDYWFVLLTNHPDGHNRAGGVKTWGADFRMDDGEIYQRAGMSGAWESIISVWPVEGKNKAAKVFSHVAEMVDLAYEQHIGS